MRRIANLTRTFTFATLLAIGITVGLGSFVYSQTPAAPKDVTWTGGGAAVGTGKSWWTIDWKPDGTGTPNENTVWTGTDSWGKTYTFTGAAPTPLYSTEFVELDNVVFGSGSANKTVELDRTATVGSMELAGTGWRFNSSGGLTLTGTKLTISGTNANLTLDRAKLVFTNTELAAGWRLNAAVNGGTFTTDTLTLNGITATLTNDMAGMRAAIINIADGGAWTIAGRESISGDTLNVSANRLTMNTAMNVTTANILNDLTLTTGANVSNWGSDINITAGKTLTIGSNADLLTLSGAIDSAGADSGLVFIGSKNVTLSGAVGTTTAIDLTTATAGAANAFSGIATFSGGANFGDVHWQSGTLRLAGATTVDSLNFASTAVLDLRGDLTLNNNTTFSGTIMIGGDPPGQTKSITMSPGGELTFDGATYNVDLVRTAAAQGSSDQLTVIDGIVKLDNTNTIFVNSISDLTNASTEFQIMTANSISAIADLELDFASLRWSGDLALRNGDSQLWIENLTIDNNIKLFWTAGTNANWDDVTQDMNWIGENGHEEYFTSNDWVVFGDTSMTDDGALTDGTVTVAADVTVSQMDVLGGEWTFDGANKITGDDGSPVTDEGGNISDGSLNVAGGATVHMNIETDFDTVNLGSATGTATFNLGHDNALGSADINIKGDTTLGHAANFATTAIAIGNDFTFDVANKTLSFNADDGYEFTTTGDFDVNANTTISNIGDGGLSIQGDIDVANNTTLTIGAGSVALFGDIDGGGIGDRFALATGATLTVNGGVQIDTTTSTISGTLVVGSDNTAAAGMAFGGDTTFSGSTLKFDLDLANGGDIGTNAPGTGDKINVTGNVITNTANPNKIVLGTFDAATSATHDYLLIASTGGFDGNAADIIAAFELQLGHRQLGELAVGPVGGPNASLWVVGFHDNVNKAVYWTGDNSAEWDMATENWRLNRTADPMAFITNDYVIFDDTEVDVEEYTITLAADQTVSGMEVNNGVFTINNDPSAPPDGYIITGIEAIYYDGNTINDDVLSDGALTINGGEITLNVATSFVGGTVLNGGRVNIGHTDALGNIDITTDKYGVVAVNGDATIGAGGSYTIKNDFELNADSVTAAPITLTFDIENGETLTNDGTFSVKESATMDNDGTGSLALNAYQIAEDKTLTLDGNGDIYFRSNNTNIDDGVAIVKNGSNTLHLQGNYTFNGNNNTVSINAGSFHLGTGTGANAADLTLNGLSGSGASFNLATGATLYGNGTITADEINLSGTVMAGESIRDVGQLNFVGDLYIDQMTWNLTLTNTLVSGNEYESDKIINTGNTDLSKVNDLLPELNVASPWQSGNRYQIMDSAGFFDGTYTLDDATINDYFKITAQGFNLNSRQGANLSIENGGTELWLEIADGLNQYLTWTGIEGRVVDMNWGGTQENWIAYESGDLSTRAELPFLDGDYVIFDNVGSARSNITLVINPHVAGMEINYGTYTFSSDSGTETIVSDRFVHASNGLGMTEQLRISSGNTNVTNVTMNVATDFRAGTILTGGASGGGVRINIGHDDALGVFDANDYDAYLNNWLSGSLTGFVSYSGSVSVYATEAGDADNAAAWNVTNRFKSTDSDSHLSIGGNQYTTLVLQDTGHDGDTPGDKGSVIHTIGNLSIYGNTTIEGGTGPVIYMASGSWSDRHSLTFDTDNIGDIAVDGSIQLGDYTDIIVNADTDSTVAIGDGTTAFEVVTLGYGNNFTKNGVGTLVLNGESYITSTSGYAININAGELRLASDNTLGYSTLYTDLGTFNLASGATITGSGRVGSRNNIVTLNGTLSPDSYDSTGQGSAISSILVSGTTVTFDEASLMVDLGTQNDTIDSSYKESDRIYGQTGTNGVVFNSGNEIFLNNWGNGQFALIVSNDGILGSASDWSLAMADGSVLNPNRQHGVLSIGQYNGEDALILTTSTTNASMIWNNGGVDENMQWSHRDDNWLLDDGSQSTFLAGDYATFNGLGQGTIEIDSQGVQPSGMSVSDGRYVFTGGAISGAADTTNTDWDGGLKITGGSVEFANAGNSFAYVNISRGTMKVNADTTTTVTDGNFTVGSRGNFVFMPSQTATTIDVQNNGTIIFNGNVSILRPADIADLTASDSPMVYSDVFTTENVALNTTRLNELFNNKIDGLLLLNTGFNNGNKSMDLIYTAILPDRFAALQGMSTNEQHAAEQMSDVFMNPNAPIEFQGLYDLMRNMNNAEVSQFINESRGIEQAANAQRLALWSPWRAVFNRLNRSQCDNRQGLYHSIGGGVNNTLGQMSNGTTRNVWIEGFHHSANIKSDGNARKYDTKRSGLVIGGDTQVATQTRIGGAFTYGDLRLSSQFGRTEGDDWGFGAYVRQGLHSDFHLNGYIGYGHQQWKHRRHELGYTLKDNYDSDAFYASVELARPVSWRWGGVFMPLIALDYQSVSSDDFTETGSPFAKTVKNETLDSSVLRFGLNSRWATHDMVSFDTRLQYGYQFAGRKAGSLHAAYANLDDASKTWANYRGAEIGRHLFNIGIGTQIYLNCEKNTYFFADYDFDAADNYNAHLGQFGIAIHW